VKDGADGGGLVARRGHEAEERKEGVRSRGRRRRRKIGRGGKGGAAVMGHPFKEVRQGGGATRRRGVGKGMGASAVVGRCGVAGSGARKRRACRLCTTSAETGEAGDYQVGPQHRNEGQDLNSKKKKSNLI
jgi:hypothetical protein